MNTEYQNANLNSNGHDVRPIIATHRAMSLEETENKQAHERYLGCELASVNSIHSFEFGNLSDLGETSTLSSNATVTESEELTDYSQLDRYGFIVVASKRMISVDGLSEEESKKREQERRGRREAKRAIKWVEMLRSLEFRHDMRDWLQAHRKFEERLVKGIPDCLRTKVWPLFLGVPQLIASSQTYRDLYLKISGYERQIDLDIERTLRDHILFKARFSVAQVSLFKVLVAYSNLDPEVGYCQGMSTIAAFLLLYFEEEMAFNIIRALFERDGCRKFFTAGFPLLFETFYVQEQLMRKYMPTLLARLSGFHISTSIYATKWYLTLFLGFPFSLATRIWDLMLYWGPNMLICVALALLKLHEHRLLSLEYEGCMQFLSKLPETPLDEQKLISLTWAIWKRIYPHYAEHDPRRNLFSELRKEYARITASSS